MPTTKLFDPAAYLDTSESITTYLKEGLDTDDPAFIADTVKVIERALEIHS